jgi:hypothetical protein
MRIIDLTCSTPMADFKRLGRILRPPTRLPAAVRGDSHTTLCTASECDPVTEARNGDPLLCLPRRMTDSIGSVQLNFVKARTPRSRRLIKRVIGSVGEFQQVACRRKFFSNIIWGRRSQTEEELLAPAASCSRTIVLPTCESASA